MKDKKAVQKIIKEILKKQRIKVNESFTDEANPVLRVDIDGVPSEIYGAGAIASFQSQFYFRKCRSLA